MLMAEASITSPACKAMPAFNVFVVPSLPVNTISAAHGAAMVVLTSEP